MRFVFFDPPYSNFFNDIGIEIMENNYPVAWIGSRICDWVYYPNLEFSSYLEASISDMISDAELGHIIVTSASLANNESRALSDSDVSLVKKYIRQYLRRISYNDTGIFYNDCRWNHAILIAIFKKLKMRYFVFERGPIRGATCAVDTKGVNSRSEFCRSFPKSEARYSAFDLSPRPQVKHLKLRFVFYRMLKLVSDYILKISHLNDTKKQRFHYFKIFCKGLNLASKFEKINQKEKILVALQLESDSQIVLGDTFKSNQDFIDTLLSTVDKAKPTKKKEIIFKKHPLDLSEYNYYGRPNIPENQSISFEDLAGIITINSTVGFEALLHEVPVLVFGSSFYTHDSWVYCENDLENFVAQDVECKVGSDEVLNTIKGNYMLPGDIFNYTASDIELVTRKILEL